MHPKPLALHFGNLGTTEILLIVLALLLFFGGRKIPELARGLGRGIGEFRQGMREPTTPKPPETPPSRDAKDSPPDPPKP